MPCLFHTDRGARNHEKRLLLGLGGPLKNGNKKGIMSPNEKNRERENSGNWKENFAMVPLRWIASLCRALIGAINRGEAAKVCEVYEKKSWICGFCKIIGQVTTELPF